MGITIFQWVQVAWMVGVGAALLVFRSGIFVGTKDEHLRRSSDQVSDLTATVQRELKRVESQGEAKADVKALASTEARLNDRIDYLDKRLTELVARTDKRFDDGSERMSKISGKITEMVDIIRGEIAQVRERVARVEGGNGNGR